MEEQRQEPRVEIELEIRYRTVQEFLTAYSRNISGGGLFIRMSQPHTLNQKVVLRFTLPGLDHEFEIPGIVVWSHASPRSSFPAGMGVKFLQIKPEDAKRITEFVKSARGAEAPAPKKKKT